MLETDVRTDRATPYLLWVAVCTAALALVGIPVVGGLVAGAALGLAQGVVLARGAPHLSRARYLAATLLVAGAGWAAASAPSVVGGGPAERPPVLLVVLGAAVVGVVLGLVLGAAQAATLRGAVRHPRRWVAANAAAWPAAVLLIVLVPVLPLGAALGGAVVGLVTGLFVPTLSGVSASSRVVLALLAAPRTSGMQRSLIGLEVHGRRSGRRYRFPVQYAVAPGGLAVLPGRPSRKTWWRNVDHAPTRVEVLREGVWAPASARCLGPHDEEYAAVLAAYLERWPDAPAEVGQPLVLVRLGAAVGIRDASAGPCP